MAIIRVNNCESENMSTDIDTMVGAIQKKSKWIKLGVGIGVVTLLGPILWFAVSAMLGAAALGLATALVGAICLAIVNFTPVVAMKLENAKINAIKAEATKNPIPTLQASLIEDKKARDEDDRAITDFDSEISNIEDKFDTLTRDLTPKDVDKFRSDIEEMKTELFAQQKDLAEVDRIIGLKEVAIKRASAIWQLSMVIGGANAKFSQRNADAAIKQIKEETAIDSVNKAMATSRAQLRQRVRNRQEAPSPLGITSQPTNVIEMEVTQQQKVAR